MRQPGNLPALERNALIAGAIALLCLVWLAMEVTRGGTLSFDENVRGAIHSAASPGLTLAFQSVTLLGSQPAIIGLSVGAALILFLRGRRDLALLALLTLGGAELLEVVLKIQFHRQRPEPFFATPLPVS